MNKTFQQVENNPQKEYRAKQAQIRKLLKRIEDGLEKHNRRAHSVTEPHWGHVGDLTSIVDTLQDLDDRLHMTGEYARSW